MQKAWVRVLVDAGLLRQARALHSTGADAVVVEAALRAFVTAHQPAEIDAQYDVYDQQPLNQQDAWGHLASWSQAAKNS